MGLFGGGCWAPTSRGALEDAERTLLAGIPRLAVRDVPVSPPQDPHPLTIHTIDVSPGPPVGGKAPLVIWPGFGMGAASFGLAFEELRAELPDRAIYAVDWLGYGLSSRPKWTAKGVQEAEAWFCDALDKWRGQNGLEKIALTGHSMGGYLAVAYAERYGERVEHLLLVSPCGVPHAPSKAEQDARVKNWSLLLRVVFGLAFRLWAMGVSPQGVARALGPFGKSRVLWYPHRRFADHNQWTSNFSKDTFGPYLWHMAAAPPSGEYMLTTLLKPFAYAKEPLIDRIPKLNVGAISFMYGGKGDWMDHTAAEKTLQIIADSNQSRLCVVDANVVKIPNAGHQLYIDNPTGFVHAIVKCLRQPNVVCS